MVLPNHGLVKYLFICYRFDNIFTRFGPKIYKQNVGIKMGTSFAPLITDLFCSLWKRFDEVPLTGKSGWYYWSFQSRFQLLNIDNVHFEQMIYRIYLAERDLIKLILLISKHCFLDWNLPISNDTVSIKMYDASDNFEFDMVWYG